VLFFCCCGKANLVQIFLLNPNFLLLHRNRYSEGMDDGQKTPHGHPNFHSYVKIQRVFIFQTSFWLTLFYSTLLALTHRQNHRQRNKYTCFAWATETFFPVMLMYVVSVFDSGRKKVLVYIHMYYLEYKTVMVLC
jgi:hypothetical protein